MKISWKNSSLKKIIHKTYNDSFLIKFLNNAFKILVFNKFDKNQFNFEDH